MAHRQRIFERLRISTGQVLVAAYGIIYILYVVKYSWFNRPYPLATLILYGLIVPAVLLVACKWGRPYVEGLRRQWMYPSAVAVVAIGLILLMSQFDPSAIQIGRYPALVEWIQRLVAGDFPYHAGSKPSEFPFLFLLATPFYYLGDVGLLQVFGLVLFAAVVHSRYREKPVNRFKILVLLLVSPIFLFEVTVRSELIANSVVILAGLEIVRRRHMKPGRAIPIALGLLLGLCASTRGIFAPAYLIMLPMVLKQHNWKFNLSLTLAMATGFVGTLLPFVLWETASFFDYGPFSIQLSHIPSWLLVVVLVVSAILGLSLKSSKQAYAATALLLFGIVFIKFLMSLAGYGIAATVIFDNHFDMAYFGFSLPFILIALKHNAKTAAVSSFRA